MDDIRTAISVSVVSTTAADVSRHYNDHLPTGRHSALHTGRASLLAVASLCGRPAVQRLRRPRDRRFECHPSARAMAFKRLPIGAIVGVIAPIKLHDQGRQKSARSIVPPVALFPSAIRLGAPITPRPYGSPERRARWHVGKGKPTIP